jgi:hypothetical protein
MFSISDNDMAAGGLTPSEIDGSMLIPVAMFIPYAKVETG